jgi:hypothetical protein
MKERSAEKRGYGDEGRWVKYWTCWGCWISPCHCPLSLDAGFETYEPFIYLILIFFPAAVNRGYWTNEYGGTTLYGIKRTWFVCIYVKDKDLSVLKFFVLCSSSFVMLQNMLLSVLFSIVWYVLFYNLFYLFYFLLFDMFCFIICFILYCLICFVL